MTMRTTFSSERKSIQIVARRIVRRHWMGGYQTAAAYAYTCIADSVFGRKLQFAGWSETTDLYAERFEQNMIDTWLAIESGKIV